MNLLHRFIFNAPEPIIIDGHGLQHDRELEARNQERVQRVIAQLGDKWVLSKRVERKP